jgi:beta-glucosidase
MNKITITGLMAGFLFVSEMLLAQKNGNEQLIDSLIGQMTIEEKVGMIHGNSSFTSGGVPRLNIPELVMSDGPHGVRMEHGRGWKKIIGYPDSCTYLPTGTALAATWNPQLGYEYGCVLGSEAKYRGKDVILGPGINIIRTPLNGRNFEYLSEDPFLISKMAVGYIKGVQDQGISACVKHFIANNQEKSRFKIDVNMSDRALREIYLPGFKAAVQEAKVNTVMGAYNKFRGQHCSHNAYLLNTVLKQEWGFNGILISDWAAVHNTMEAIQNGTDIEMGTDLDLKSKDYGKFYLGDTVINLVKAGLVSESLIDEKVRRILRIMYRTNMLGNGKRTPGEFCTPAHQKTALTVAQEAITLLKNEKILPLQQKSIKTLAVIGANATRKHAGMGGSSQVNAKYEVTPLEGIQRMAGNNIHVKYAEGYRVTRDTAFRQQELFDEAVKTAQNADVVVFVGGLIRGYSNEWDDNAYDTEGRDRPDMKLPFGQDKLIEAVLKANPNTVIVLVSGGPAEMPWSDKAKGIVQAWYSGSEGGNALAQVLFGQINPSGKLPVTFPKKLEDSPAHKLGEYPGKNLKETYNEDIFVGYRYFDTYKVEPLFCFGHGLSYTTFAYSKIHVTTSGQSVNVKLTIANTGTMDGAEVVQLYVKDDETSVKRPEKELKAFYKVFLKVGEKKEISIDLPESSFQYWDEGKGKFVIEPGKFIIMAGSSSRDIRVTSVVNL